MLWIVEAVIWTVQDDPEKSESSSVLAAKNSLWIFRNIQFSHCKLQTNLSHNLSQHHFCLSVSLTN